jgi:hypothetical protein
VTPSCRIHPAGEAAGILLAFYNRLREERELTANLVQKGIRQAVEATGSGVERLKNDQNTSRPTFTADTAVYDKRSAPFHRDHVSLVTVDGRVECGYVLPTDADTPPTEYVASEDYEFRQATLHRRDGDWYLHASMLREDDDTDTTTRYGTVLGVNRLAVASTAGSGRQRSSTTGNGSTRNGVATCGFTHDNNRHQESFECQQCGYENHADYTAAENIGLQYLRRRQNADDGGAPVDVRLNRGTLNVSGEYTLPAADAA